MIYAPGTILANMYLRERVRLLDSGRFIEVGAGRGHVSRLLLQEGWRGVAYELNPESAAVAEGATRPWIGKGRFTVRNRDWLQADGEPAVDLLISSMVLEHLSDDDEAVYFERGRRVLKAGGRAVILVPANPAAWGVEDEIAGHYRRYTVPALEARLRQYGWKLSHHASLTFPLSNLLLPVSNLLVRRAERHKRTLTMRERTEASGNRDVPMKTRFPRILGFLLNEHAMYPFHILQKRFSATRRGLVLYAECVPNEEPSPSLLGKTVGAPRGAAL